MLLQKAYFRLWKVSCNGEPKLLLQYLFWMPSLNHKLTTSHIAPSKYVALKNIDIKRWTDPHFTESLIGRKNTRWCRIRVSQPAPLRADTSHGKNMLMNCNKKIFPLSPPQLQIYAPYTSSSTSISKFLNFDFFPFPGHCAYS